MITHSTGRREGGATFLGALRAGHLRYERLDQTIDAVVVHGRAAVVTGRMDADLHAGGAVRHVQALSTAVWVRRARRWRLLAFQTTGGPPDPTGSTV